MTVAATSVLRAESRRYSRFPGPTDPSVRGQTPYANLSLTGPMASLSACPAPVDPRYVV